MNKTDFNVEIFLNNIDYYCKKKNIKIGELERMTGVSTGYFAKVRRHQGEKIPKMHIALAVSENLGVPLNILALIDHNAMMDDTTRRLIEYITAMAGETMAYRMRWEQASSRNLSRLPSLGEQEFFSSQHTSYGDYITTVFVPNTSRPIMVGNVYYSQIRENSYIYFIKGFGLPASFLTSDYRRQTLGPFLGLWLVKNGKIDYITSALEKDSSPIYTALQSLKSSIKCTENASPDMSSEVKNELDAFLKKTAFFSGV